MYQCIYELWLYDSSNITTKYILKYSIKRALDTEMMNSCQLSDSKQRIKKFSFIYHLTFPKGRCMTFQGRCKKSQGRCKTISGEVPTSPQNPPMTKFWNLFKDTFWHFLRHFKCTVNEVSVSYSCYFWHWFWSGIQRTGIPRVYNTNLAMFFKLSNHIDSESCRWRNFFSIRNTRNWPHYVINVDVYDR
jgi:hypothetical protein